ncbi:piezo-type mechanosensitive ion channel homolog isoform X2 [Papaver somniferum]|uniref:piezo-type mechanosensitive ion channel homolog isoform X2 n=1 Tax=Papaver somniferum TaxID=3469 RepID=UPI000E704CAF|nr:piezo-type mechanosensitive ion channel homolog isoform X2 [Papaver somniferum]
MGNFLHGFVFPLLLLTAALLNWSIISLVELLIFLVIQYTSPNTGLGSQRRFTHCCIIAFCVLATSSQMVFHIIWAVKGKEWSIADASWAKLVGFASVQPWGSSTIIYSLVVQLLVALVAILDIRWSRVGLVSGRGTCWRSFSSYVVDLGSHVRVACCLFLPAVQLVVGISHPSWVSLPFFICSCVGLVDWSLTSNFLGLFWWWRHLLAYAGFYIALLYTYQLPINFSIMVQTVAEFIGLYKVSAALEWTRICCCISLLIFYLMLSIIKCDLEEMNFIMSTRNSSLSEQLLPSRHSFFIRRSRSGVRHTNMLLRGAVFRTFSINFFTYGFPVSLVALSVWGFFFTSVCAFWLLAYVAYALYAFPSFFQLHHLNGLLLVFILLWATCTYVFNVAFTYLNKEFWEDMEIWETIGFWHYPIPGFFLLAQFCLGILVAIGNLVNNTVFMYMADVDRRATAEDYSIEEGEETKVLIIATLAWGLRRCSRTITLALIFFLAIKPGFIHAIYMIFFLLFLMSHNVSRKLRQSLILLCETHFALMYILQLNMVSKALKKRGSLSMGILSQLGLLEPATTWDFLQIAVLLCFCVVHHHGFEMLFSYSAIVRHMPCTPVGFSILRAGLNKSVLLSVFTSPKSRESRSNKSSYERRIATYLNAVGQMFLSAYRSYGTYISFLTVLVTVYRMKPNYISFGFLFFLLFWITGRQLVEVTRRRLWFPLKVYSIVVFVFIYSLSIFSSFTTWLTEIINLSTTLGYNPETSLLQNIREPLTVLIVMQLYSYGRRQSIFKYNREDDMHLSQTGLLGFIRRLLIWHSEKILCLAVFYASITPISAFGLLYLLGLVICSTLPKASRVPSKVFLVYTGVLVIAEYLYQMWGKQAEMFPSQKYTWLSTFLGLQQFNPGCWGMELGFRGKVLVIIACTLQYNVFHWMEMMPTALVNTEKWEEPCPLFLSIKDMSFNISICDGESEPSENSSLLSVKGRSVISKSWPSFISSASQQQDPGSSATGGSRSSTTTKNSVGCTSESHDENYKWNKKQILASRKERMDMQKKTLKVYLKFWTENAFNLFGLEINMIALLLASFAVLNIISMLYIASLAACVLLGRQVIHKLWPLFVFAFASILTFEYLAIWKDLTSWNQHVPSEQKVHCHDCWRSSVIHFNYCRSCWLGVIVDDPRMLISYYVVFMLACFKLRADRCTSLTGSVTFHQVISECRSALVWRDLSFETKSLWTFLDYLRLYSYCHLLDVVLALILITGTLEYDILHLGYLGFALIFFRLRLEILKRKNQIFKFLRMYNFALIILSLAYQSPFVDNVTGENPEKIEYIYEMIGLYKYDYGFRITSRSALVEIIIFMLVSLQSYMFSSQEFDYASKYLEAEQIGAIVREQEKKAAWKTAQLQYIRKSEEKKRQRNLQVEKMKSEMLNLQTQLHGMNSTVNCVNCSSEREGLRRRKRRYTSLHTNGGTQTIDKELIDQKQDLSYAVDSSFVCETNDYLTDSKVESPSSVGSMGHGVGSPICEIRELGEETLLMDSNRREKERLFESPLISAVQLIGDGVSQVQSLGNQAMTNFVNLLNITHEDSETSEYSSADDGAYEEIESQNRRFEHLGRFSSVQSGSEFVMPESTSRQIGRVFRYVWAQMRANNDFVCYCCFVIVFLWNFSLLSMVYLTALFLYALCVNSGPSYIFWVIMLVYTEVYVLLLYVYQIIIQHWGLDIQWDLLHELGFPSHPIMSSFVVSTLPLFLVYVFTLLQCSIIAKDGEWVSVMEFKFFRSHRRHPEEVVLQSSLTERAERLVLMVRNVIKAMVRLLSRHWKSLTRGAESPPYFVQLSMVVKVWPDDGIQPERIESGINKLLKIVHDERCRNTNPNTCTSASRIRVQSIERSQETPNIALTVFEVIYASDLTECPPTEWYKSLTPAMDVAKEIIKAQRAGLFDEIAFPYPIVSVIGGGKRELDLYAYIFCADLVVLFLIAIFYQSVIKNNSEFLEVYQLEDQFPKEFVFVLMAIQIRYGVPHKSTLYRQFLTSKVSHINYLGFRLYRALPFLYELRCVLDWSCTTTSLTMYDWLKLEDIHSSLYLVKCDVDLNRSKRQQGDKQTKMTKFCSGICLFFVLICVIWAPMLMYSSGNPTNIANPIKGASVQIDIKTEGGKLTLYETTLCKKISWDDIDVDLDPRGYLDTYNVDDIQFVCCQADASTVWLVPPVVLHRFVQTINDEMSISFSWVFTRDRPKGKEIVKYEIVHDLFPEPSIVEAVFNGTANNFRMYDVYPRYFRVTGSGDVRLLEQAVDQVSGDLILNRGNTEWWSFNDLNASTGCGDLTGPMAIIVSEETPQGILGETLSKFSIWGLYISFVLAVGRFIRLQCSDLRMRIPFENLPSCDRLIAICEDIYAARAEGELEVEEVLYWTLVKIYRSPHMLLEYTKPD